jgi:DNA-binding transcriptional regulator/RsmH inhibitor MraZ
LRRSIIIKRIHKLYFKYFKNRLLLNSDQKRRLMLGVAALYILDQKGRVLISRAYRSDLP